MEFTWPLRARVGAAFAVGIILIGLLGWPLGAPADPHGAVCFESIGWSDAAILVLLALASGFIGYFVSWPYGREIGILAVPAGLGVWACRSGSMADVLRQHPQLQQRLVLLSAFKWEPLFWLAVVAVGFAGVLAAKCSCPKKTSQAKEREARARSSMYLNNGIAFFGSVLIAQFGIRLFAQDVEMYDAHLNSVVGQPVVAQIAFGVFVSFLIAGFVVKKTLDSSYIWPCAASAFVSVFVLSLYVDKKVLNYLHQALPPVFFSNAGASVLPVQMVSFGVLGSVAGYWLAVRYSGWRKHA